jgi:CRP-like cAMP-binding protein
VLRTTRLFAGLDEAAIDELGRKARLRSFRRGDTVFLAGEPGDSLYAVVSGLVKLFLTSARGEELVLATAGPGDAFGELSLIDEGGRSTSAEAVEPSSLLVVDRTSFIDFIHERPEVVDRLLVTLGSLVRRITDQAGDLVFLDLHGRVAKLLLHLAADESGGVRTDVDIPFSQSDLADMVGASRQTVNQILRSFQAAGYIHLKGRGLKILRADSLRHRAAD